MRDGGAYGCAVPRAYANLNPGLGGRTMTPATRLRYEHYEWPMVRILSVMKSPDTFTATLALAIFTATVLSP